MLGGALCWAVYTIISRYALAGDRAPSALALTTITTLWAAALLSVGFPLEWSDWSLGAVSVEAWASILYLGAGGTALAFVWYAQGLAKLGPARASVFNNLVPVFGVLLGTWLLNEALLASMVVGGLIALLGVSLTNWTPRPK
jgi:drug/metabolite transporter (DMT)-like permease